MKEQNKESKNRRKKGGKVEEKRKKESWTETNKESKK
jgi:hypothetical protein